MHYLTGENIRISGETAVTIGKFDGLHLGHLCLLKELASIARKRALATVIFSFSPHPGAFFAGRKLPLLLTTEEKLWLLAGLGIDYFVEYPFTHEFSQIGPEDFIKNIVHDKLGCRALVVGRDFRFGKSGTGDVALAKKLGAQLGFSVCDMPHYASGGEKISSCNIRKYIREANFAKVKKMTGRDYFIIGRVENGIIIPDAGKILPPPGAYAVAVNTDNGRKDGVANVGDVVEICLPQADAELNGLEVRIDFKGG